MTDQESAKFIEEMLVAFPDLEETARFNSPDLAATHRTWGQILSKCTYAECRQVLDDWLVGSGPDRADAKRPAHAVRAVVMQRRDKAANARDHQERVQAYKQLPNTPYTESNMRDAMLRWRPFHARYKTGELGEQEYQLFRQRFLSEIR